MLYFSVLRKTNQFCLFEFVLVNGFLVSAHFCLFRFEEVIVYLSFYFVESREMMIYETDDGDLVMNFLIDFPLNDS
jgi:hypothetical protein